MNKQSKVGVGALLGAVVFASGAATAGGLALPAAGAGQSAAVPGFSTATPSSSAALPAMPASASALPASAGMSYAASDNPLPGLDELGKQVNAIRPIRIPGGNNGIPSVPVPLPLGAGG